MARARGIKKPHPLGSLPSRSGISLLTAESGIVTSLGVKISALPAASGANDTDQFEVNQGGTSRRITVDQLFAGGTAADWDDITDKPATFPPTVPIAYTDISGTPTIPTTLPPNGAAGGDLGGTYPNPTIKASVVLTGTPTVPGYLALGGGTLTAAGTTGTVADTLLVSRTAFSATGTGARLYLAGSNATSRSVYIEGINTSGASQAHDLVFGTSSASAAPVERMRIGSTGTVALTGALTGTTATFTGTVTAPGAQIQMVSTQTGAVATGTTLIPSDDTIPQITEGDQYMTLAITPKSATSKLIINVTMHLSSTVAAANAYTAALFQDSTANALAALSVQNSAASAMHLLTFVHTMTSGTTSSTTFRVRAGSNSASTMTFNGTLGARVMGGVMASSIVIREVAV